VINKNASFPPLLVFVPEAQPSSDFSSFFLFLLFFFLPNMNFLLSSWCWHYAIRISLNRPHYRYVSLFWHCLFRNVRLLNVLPPIPPALGFSPTHNILGAVVCIPTPPFFFSTKQLVAASFLKGFLFGSPPRAPALSVTIPAHRLSLSVARDPGEPLRFLVVHSSIFPPGYFESRRHLHLFSCDLFRMG